MSSKATNEVQAPSAAYATRIDDVTLPPAVSALADEYEAVIGDRDRFLWKWIYSLLPAFTLSSVPEAHRETVRVRKTVLTVYVTFLDDLAELHGDAPSFRAVSNLVGRPDRLPSDPADADRSAVRFGRRTWEAFETGVSDAPCHDDFREPLEYDLRQAVNSMEYSRLLNDNVAMANLAGAEHYTPHNMVMFPYADVDLMYSPGFDLRDLGALREVTWQLQKLARIGNWLTTWEREVEQGDYTSGVVIYALREGIVSSDDLEADDRDAKERVKDSIRRHGVEERFLDEWWQRYSDVSKRDVEADSVDLDAYIRGMETVMEHHLASRGHK